MLPEDEYPYLEGKCLHDGGSMPTCLYRTFRDPFFQIEEADREFCERESININEMKSGSRRRIVSEARSRMALNLVEDYGIPLAEIARHLGVSTSAVSKMLTEKK
jgi:hypothetical protein